MALLEWVGHMLSPVALEGYKDGSVTYHITFTMWLLTNVCIRLLRCTTKVLRCTTSIFLRAY